MAKAIRQNPGFLKPMERFWEVDFTRGSALVMMLISNFITDLQYFANYSNFAQFWWWFARIIAFIFIFLVGLSLNISYAKAKKEGKANFAKYLKRGLFIFVLGLAITAVTYIFLGQNYIRFGVLHLIGLSIILAYPFLKWKKGVSLWAGLSLIVIGLLLPAPSFSSVDYFPLLPWFGVILLGLYFGKALYKNGERVFSLKHNLKISNPICFLGRNTLLIYLIHQPIFIVILYLLLGVKVF
jgi:uncharacterized membrane protein